MSTKTNTRVTAVALSLATVGGMAFVLVACGGRAGEDEKHSASTTQTTTEQVRPERAPPTTSSVAGTWSRIGARLLVRFSRDGTFVIDTSDLDAPYAAGTYEVRGRTIAFTSNGPGCADTWSWKGGITKAEDPLDDELHIVFVKGGCQVPTGTEWSFARI